MSLCKILSNKCRNIFTHLDVRFMFYGILFHLQEESFWSGRNNHVLASFYATILTMPHQYNSFSTHKLDLYHYSFIAFMMTDLRRQSMMPSSKLLATTGKPSKLDKIYKLGGRHHVHTCWLWNNFQTSNIAGSMGNYETSSGHPVSTDTSTIHESKKAVTTEESFVPDGNKYLIYWVFNHYLQNILHHNKQLAWGNKTIYHYAFETHYYICLLLNCVTGLYVTDYASLMNSILLQCSLPTSLPLYLHPTQTQWHLLKHWKNLPSTLIEVIQLRLHGRLKDWWLPEWTS